VHELDFADAVRPVPVVCLKLPLTDYSLGHEVLLLRARNPLLVLEQLQFDKLPFQQQCAALIQAVDVCSQTWAENNVVHRSLWNRWRYRRVWRKWDRAMRGSNWALEIAEFRNYLAAAKTFPPSPTEEAASIERSQRGEKDDCTGRMSGAPLLANLYHFVNSEFTFPTSEYANALDFPYSRAIWLYFVTLESDGRVRIESFKEREIAIEMAEARAEALAEERKTAPKTAGLASFPPDLSNIHETEDPCQP
jgi:hypothetical protein